MWVVSSQKERWARENAANIGQCKTRLAAPKVGLQGNGIATLGNRWYSTWRQYCDVITTLRVSADQMTSVGPMPLAHSKFDGG